MESVPNALQKLQRTVEADTEVMIGELELMERANINASTKYSALADKAEDLVSTSSSIKKTNEDIKERLAQLDEIVENVDVLEHLAAEMEEWSRELEVKLRRLKRD